MHRCLYIQEILSNIFEELSHMLAATADKEEWNPSPVAPLARTCKTFHQLAIKIIWRDIPGIFVISHLMLNSMYTLKCGVVRLKVTVFPNKFINRLKKYGPLVKRIRIFSDYNMRSFHPSVLLALNSSPAIPSPLFPKLEQVELSCYAEDPMEALLAPAVILGSSSLTEVDIFTDDEMEEDASGHLTPKSDGTQWEAFANRLVPFAHQLQRFSLHINRGCADIVDTPPLVRLCSAFSDSMVDLHVRCIQLPYTAIASLADLSHLATLRLTVNDQNCGASIASTSARLAFPALLDLSVTTMSITSGRTFFSGIDAGHLEALKIQVTLLDDEEAWEEDSLSSLLEPLGKWKCTRTLSEVRIDSQKSHAFTVKDATFRTLATLRNITDLRIFPCSHSLSDKGLLVAFSSWNHLRHLSLRRYSGGLLQSLTLSLAGVHKALQHCPQLTRLDLECDFRELPSSTSPHQVHRQLACWHVDCSPIANGQEFAEWAKKHYPKLREFDYFPRLRQRIAANFDGTWESSRQAMVYLDQWNDVPRLLKTKQ
ncbi:hypothetical protein BKA70DRAFT_1207960 [Coprinopsis sp. MPI-PUGE-AT-0042]|nr:hypothetical protein BKA70DRAFT_1207960 [Coprinopsis sp. MPI-PUGE-AT-0042]